MTAAVEAEEPGEKHEGERGRVHKNASIYIVSQLVSWCVSFLGISVIPRVLGESSLGSIVSATTLLGTPFFLLQFGIDFYLVKEVGRDRALAGRLLGGVFGLRLALLAPTALVSMASIMLLKPDSSLWMIAAVALPSTCVGWFVPAVRGVLAGLEDAKQVTIGDILSTLGPIIGIPFLRYGPAPYVAASTSITFIWFAVQLRGVSRHLTVRPIMDPALWRDLIRGGMPFFVNNSIRTVFASASLLAFRPQLGDAGIGVLNQAMRLLGTFMFLPTAISTALLPAIARLADAEPEQFASVRKRVLSLVIAVGLPITAMVFVLAVPICHLLYGKSKFVLLPPVLQLVALCIVPMYVVSVMYQFLVAQNRNLVWSRFLVVTGVLSIGGGVALIPWAAYRIGNGAFGAFMGMLIAETVSAACALALLGENLLDSENRGRLVRALFCAAATAVLSAQGLRLLAPLTTGLGGVGSLIQVVVPGVFGIALFGILAYRLNVFAPEEQEKLKQIVLRKLGRS